MRVFITGGTGSFGNAFVASCLETNSEVSEIVIFSRDEMKQWEMADRYKRVTKLKFVIGDVRDTDALKAAMHGADFVIHAAATKIVPVAEYNPVECIKTNVLGAVNVIDAVKHCGVPRTVALSTDKACNPINLYGASKLASDKLFVAANLKSTSSSFAVVRYGNVMGSRGSVIPFFRALNPESPVPITDPAMTRFMISLEQGVNLVWLAYRDMVGGEIYVKKIPSMRITEIANVICPDKPQQIVGIRPGEKIHEQMISAEDAETTFSYDSYYKILPRLSDWHSDPARIKSGTPVQKNFVYDSGTNDEWMSESELLQWLRHYENENLIL